MFPEATGGTHALPAGSLFDRPRFNVAPTTPIAAIRESRSGGRALVALKWGLK
jgi:putative SOS response-associated peptidase YedK